MTYTDMIKVKQNARFPLSFSVKIVAENEEDLKQMIEFLGYTMIKKQSWNKWRHDLKHIFEKEQ